MTSSVVRQISRAWALESHKFRVHRGCGRLSEAEAVPAGVFSRLRLGPQELRLASTESPTLVNGSVQRAASFLKHLI